MGNSKKKLVIVFGGQSGEHEVSLESAASVLKAVDKTAYDVYLLGVTKEGKSLLVDCKQLSVGHSKEARDLVLSSQSGAKSVVQSDDHFVVQSEAVGKLKPDIVFPLIHGTTGEDGVLQGYLDFMGVPYVGSGVLASALCMDKDMTKKVLIEAGIPVVPYMAVKKALSKNSHQLKKDAEIRIGYPCFIKPANMGSSVGIHKVKSAAEFDAAVADAFRYDDKILIEKGLSVKEYEVAILGNDEPQASCVGEIIPTHEFYSYEAKYLDENGAHLKIPADIPDSLSQKLQEMAIKTFEVLGCAGLARIDFFYDKATGEIYLNEVNTLPGFTAISMYPKLWAASGIGYSDLINRLVDLALERQRSKAKLLRSYTK